MRALIALLLVTATTPIATAGTPYAGWETRPIKALSSQQIDDLRDGSGMSLALSAELNGYPGPKHILELEGQLELTTAQRQAVAEAYAKMREEARGAGDRVLEAERKLDRLFVTKTADVASLERLVRQTGETRSRLRTIHLKYHLEMVHLLTTEQHERYQRLRGYRASQHLHGKHH